MVSYFNCRLLLASLVIPYTLLGEVIFRCPTCTAERQAACPKLTATSCTEIVREPGCGCCPVCARQHGESCGVYTPRCSNGLRCYPTPDSDIMPLEQLIKGMGQCGDKKESVEPQPTVSYDIREHSGEVSGTKAPSQRKQTKENPRLNKDSALQKAQSDMRKTMRTHRLEEARTVHPRTGQQCQQELDKILEEISKMTFLNNKGSLENLYELKFPNCDKEGQYNRKQCHMSTHGQRGECWCVDPLTGMQLQASPKVRGDPNCSQYLPGGGPETKSSSSTTTTAAAAAAV
ncbi:insulin-like growth factor-binding protein 2-B [Engraulis encrasicolus]|uniref:insulin-like growth factor-binding protein 2-B n=1 Tax=Engraulis encrasicolus TaxID=184585 RepID=UPI002FD6A7B3